MRDSGKLIKILELLKDNNNSIYDNLNISNSSIFSKSRSFLNRNSFAKNAKSSSEEISQNLGSLKNLRYSVGKRPRLSHYYRWNKEGLLERTHDSRRESSEIYGRENLENQGLKEKISLR